MLTKDDILREIKRTAKLNGDEPLGKQKFLTATSIKESDWLGKYWVKWSDAISEAGFTPNRMQSAYPEPYLLEQYALLILQLGRLPTTADVKMKSQTNGDFPSHNSFSRFGGKAALLRKVHDFCKSNVGFADALAILIKEPSWSDPLESDSPVSNLHIESGYVYLMLFGAEYKIGSSNSVERRFREIRTQMPYEGKIIHSISTGDPDGIEAYWHSFFKEKRLNGEWFKLNSADVRYFKKRKLM